ncbi:hypothetical protein [Microbispora sp. H10949]|uniref:hypothetical protein n=1 Tax=Microbispora sp. H10949 TaxID=2729111 RepID=UPI001603EDBA|nr:hypothetical protein [Microbispora sp. H10949]
MIQALTTDEDVAERVRASLPAAHLRRVGDGAALVKTTYDLDPPLYQAFKLWTAQHDTTGAAVLRVLLSILATDKGQLATRLML